MTDNKIEIALSKTKLVRLIFYSLCFLAIGIWVLIAQPHTGNALFDNILVKVIAMYGSIAFGLAGMYFYGKKILDKKPGLVLSEEGIYDNTSMYNFGLIPWRDVNKVYEKIVEVSMASKQYFVTVGLVNPEDYILRETNILKRKMLKANLKMYHSPVNISAGSLKISHAELLKLASGYFEKYKQKNMVPAAL